MDKHPHIIGRQIFDIDFSSREDSHLLQDKISSIFNSRLIDEMNILFEKIIPSNRFIKIDNLSIDIGNIALDSLEAELPNRLLQKLEQELLLILLHDNAATEVDSSDIFAEDKKGNYLQLLEFFLLNGSFPWWAASKNGVPVTEILEYLFSKSSLQLNELIMRVGQNNNVRSRLVQQFSEQQIRYIIIILEPEEAQFIFNYHQNLVKVQREIILVKNEESDFKKAVWKLILSFLIIDRGSHFNRKEFVKNILIGMAANFNIDFRALLALFAAGLNLDSAELKNIDSLQAIIFELYVDEEPLIEKVPVKKDFGSKKKVENLSQDLDLLRYYLSFGSFPWWSSYPDQESLTILFSSLLRMQPKTMILFIRNIGQQSYSRKLLVNTFNEELLLLVVNILEPDQSEFISDYISETRNINNRNTLLKIQSDDFNVSIWEFVLEYLLVDRGSEFNRQIFLESNIRKLSNRYNINYVDLLVFLVQSIGVRHQSSVRHVSLIRDLSSLFILFEKEKLSTVSIENEQKINYGQNDLVQSNGLKNVLYYWLKYGYFPWWAGKFAESTATLLLEKLFMEAPSDALLFFKFSGQSSDRQRRILNQVSSEILYKLFRKLKDGNLAVRYTKAIILLFSDSSLFKSHDTNRMKIVIFSSLWNSYIENSYKSFKPGNFIEILIRDLALWSDMSMKSITLFLKSSILDNQFKNQINKVFRNLENYYVEPEIYVSKNKLNAWTEIPDIEQIVTEQLRIDLLKDNLISISDVLSEAIYILRYFLQHNKLPEKYKRSSTISESSFLKQLLLFLQRNKATDLENILISEKYAAENLLRLHDIVSQSDSIEESNLKIRLKTIFEKNILLFIRQKGGISFSEKSLLQFIDKLLINPFTENNRNILKSLLRYATVTDHFAYFFKNSVLLEIFEDEQQGIQLPSEIRVLNNWLLSLFDDMLDRERLEHILSSYNLMIIGGIIDTGNINLYFQKLLIFLTENHYQLMLKISLSVKNSLNNITESNRLLISRIPDLNKLISGFEKMEEMNIDFKEALDIAEKKMSKGIIKQENNGFRDQEINQLKQELREQEQLEKNKILVENMSDKDNIYIHNAGLVIMHPFLNTYFNRLKMFENGDFISDEHRHRAVHLLQYLAFGTETNEEHELVLNKILCNIPIDEPVSAGIIMTEEEKAISGELINAILTQWDKLKNTTAESFQTSFLQRDGALSRIEENWNLKVENRGYDVLLSTLPWGLGMIKTPWMTEFIYVEWI